MNNKRVFSIVLIVGAAVLVSAAVIFRPAILFQDQPEDVVQKFYDWHIRYEGNPLVDKAYRSSDLLSPEFIADLDEFTDGGMIADPILCAQDRPESVTPGKAVVSGDQAIVAVTSSFAGHGFEVELRLMDGAWKIDGVRCGNQ
jgi:hypothetical protein